MTLPLGWTRVELQELIVDGPTNGFSPPSGPAATGTWTLRLGATTTGRLALNENTTKRIHQVIPPGSKYWLRPGDILIQRANTLAYVGTTALYDGPTETYIYPDLMMRIRVGAAATPEYVAAFLNTTESRGAFRKRATGTAGNMPKINGETVRAAGVRLPPLNEQRRIVAKLEALQARSRRAREALDAVPPLLEKLRQSILAAAFRGDLTKEWRAKHPDVEPATELLKRIRIERRKKWEEAELAKLKAKGKPPTDDRWKARYKEPEPVDPSGLPELPNGWCWASVDEVITGLRNGISTKPDKNAGLRILRISSVRPLRVHLDDVRYLPHDPKHDAYSLQEGDLLITRYNGNPELVGVAGVVRGLPSQTVYPDKLMRATPVGTVVSESFLEVALNTGATRAHIGNRAKSAAGQVGVSGDDIKSAPIPVPPIREQDQVVRAVRAAIDATHRIGEHFRKVAAALTKLDASALEKAFLGELVPQDPNDEPADVMLARLRAAAPTPEPGKRRRRRSEAAE